MNVVRSITEHLYQWRRKIATGGVSVLALWVAFHMVFGANGMIAFHNKRNEYRKLKSEVEQLQADNDRIQNQIKGLKSDPKVIEKEAREQLKYAKPGEVIYVLPAPKPKQDSLSTAQNQGESTTR